MKSLKLENALGAIYCKDIKKGAVDTPFYQSAGAIENIMKESKSINEFVDRLSEFISKRIKEDKKEPNIRFI